MSHLPGYDPAREFWAFGYGSLMWRPGFDYLERAAATVHGYHRDACVYSVTYRGTPEMPGLVVGLQQGGSCRGFAYRVAPDKVAETVVYLDARELVTAVYRPKWLKATLADGRRVRAYGYVADPAHPNYAGHLSLEEKAEVVRRGVGREGTSREYLANTVAHLDDMGIPDTPLHRLLRLADQSSASPGAEKAM